MKQRFAAITLIAMVAHNVNKAYCDAIGDNSVKPWDEAGEDQQNSIRAGVEAHLANPGMTPEERHNAWSDYKIKDGWKYGEVKDAEKKTHPCLVPYGLLPKDQQVKDYLFGAVVSSMAPDLSIALSSEEEVLGEQEAPAEQTAAPEAAALAIEPGGVAE